MKFYFSFLLLVVTSLSSAFAQADGVTNGIKRELTFTLDNDIFFFRDWYYTAGHQLTYRRLVQPDRPIYKFLNRSGASPSKVLVAYTYGNKIFTPKRTTTGVPQRMDRPYAGWNYGGFSLTRLKGSSAISHFEAEVGVVGKISGMGQLQQWWHRQVGYREPRGWDSQISNEVVVNLNYQFLRSIKIANYIDLVSSSGVHAGTGLNKIDQSLTVRVMDFNSLTESTWFNGRLGYDGEDDKEEVFIFVSYGIEYVISNIFLEGSLFDNPSPRTVNAETWVHKKSFGIAHSKNRRSFLFEINYSSPEAENINRHSYVKISYARRF